MASYRDQVLPIVVTLFGSLLTVDFMYSFITYKREVLITTFILVYVIFMNLKKYITHSAPYPKRKDGRLDTRRSSLVGFCGVGMNIATIIITRLIFDMFMVARGKIHMKWWQYIDLFTIGITFLFSFLVNK